MYVDDLLVSTSDRGSNPRTSTISKTMQLAKL